jgi:hypothetical protein
VFNKFARLALVLALIYPLPVYAEEVEEIETFDDGEQTTDIVVPPTENNNLVKIDNTWSGSYGMDGHHIELEYMKHGGTSNDYEFTLPTEHDVYEVGFTIGAVNNQGSVEYTHNDETTQSNTIDAQSGLNNATMYEDIVYSVKETANKFIDSFVITINDWSLVDDISIKYDTTTTTTTTLNPLDVQRQANFASYGISETDEERGEREEEEAIIQQEIIQMEIQEAIEVEDNMAETGYSETDEERAEREARTNVTLVVGDEEVTYTEKEQNDGTIERDQERAANEELYGVALTDEQIERGDLELYDIKEENGEEFFEDDDMVLIVADEYEDEELERQMEIDAKALELTEELEIYEFETKEEAEEFIETYIEIEEYIEELEEFETEIIIIEEDINLIDIFIDNDLFPPKEEDVLEDLKEVQDELIEKEIEEEIFVDVIEILEDEEPIEETVFEVLDIFNAESGEEILSEEMVEEEVAELEEVIEDIIVVDIPEVTEEELEEYTEEEVEEYEEAKEEAIQEFVQELETEEVIEVIEEVNDIGVQNLSEATEETQAVVQAVVEEAIEEIEELTEEQVEVVAEVLQVETEDVEIIAEAIKEDEIVAEAVEEYVERAVENKDVENYTLADVVTEVQYEEFLENPIETFVDLDNIQEITIDNIGDDMTSDQKEKAQEVVVPVILTRIASMAAFIMRKS